MKALIQRVLNASVIVENNVISEIGKGMLIFFSVIKDDTEKDIDYIVRKVKNLRIFEDKERKLNFSVQDINGEILVVSQFTLSADCKKGNRPSFERAEEPLKAEKIYLEFIRRLKEYNLKVATGAFGKFMQVHLTNDGPVTIMLDSKV
ncbi:MAG: D-tyrosyl-tRNA(Tyr) deacylase [Nitrospirae bacterium]|nr:D-tyrosyl-tRNA(Tyr) deacylase [Nitrospirota bacterium]